MRAEGNAEHLRRKYNQRERNRQVQTPFPLFTQHPSRQKRQDIEEKENDLRDKEARKQDKERLHADATATRHEKQKRNGGEQRGQTNAERTNYVRSARISLPNIYVRQEREEYQRQKRQHHSHYFLLIKRI